MAEFVDPYLDPDIGLLRNLVGARTQDALDTAEGDLSYWRAAELQVRPPRSTGDLAEFRGIHRQLFQDVYPWAGDRELLRQMHHSSVPFVGLRVGAAAVGRV